MPARATGSASRPRASGVRRLVAALAGGIALAASAQSYRIPDQRPPPARVATAPRAGEPCDACGRIASIREISTARGLPAGTVSPVPGGGGDPTNPSQQNLIGAVIYLPLGGQSADKPYLGEVAAMAEVARHAHRRPLGQLGAIVPA